MGAIITVVMPIFGLFNTRYGWEIEVSDSYTLYGWRIQLLFHLVPGIVALILLQNLPESPKYLMAANKKEQCLNVLQAMYQSNFRTTQEECPIQHLTEDIELNEKRGDSEKSL